MEIDSAENRNIKEKLLNKQSEVTNKLFDITKAWSTAVEQASTLVRVEDYDADLKSDVTATINKLRAEIENHCSLAKENHCRYCSYCNNLMGVREILEIIDKYRADSEGKE